MDKIAKTATKRLQVLMSFMGDIDEIRKPLLDLLSELPIEFKKQLRTNSSNGSIEKLYSEIYEKLIEHANYNYEAKNRCESLKILYDAHFKLKKYPTILYLPTKNYVSLKYPIINYVVAQRFNLTRDDYKNLIQRRPYFYDEYIQDTPDGIEIIPTYEVFKKIIIEFNELNLLHYLGNTLYYNNYVKKYLKKILSESKINKTHLPKKETSLITQLCQKHPSVVFFLIENRKDTYKIKNNDLNNLLNGLSNKNIQHMLSFLNINMKTSIDTSNQICRILMLLAIRDQILNNKNTTFKTVNEDILSIPKEIEELYNYDPLNKFKDKRVKKHKFTKGLYSIRNNLVKKKITD